MKIQLKKQFIFTAILLSALTFSSCHLFHRDHDKSVTPENTSTGSTGPANLSPIIISGIVIDEKGAPVTAVGTMVTVVDANNNTYTGSTAAGSDSAYSVTVKGATAPLTVTSTFKNLNFISYQTNPAPYDTLDVIFNGAADKASLVLELRDHDGSAVPDGMVAVLTLGTTSSKVAVTNGFAIFSSITAGKPYTYTVSNANGTVNDVNGNAVTGTFTLAAGLAAKTTVGYTYFLK